MSQERAAYRHIQTRRLLLPLLLLLLLALAVWIAAPLVLEQVLLVKMREMGIEEPRVRVEALRPGRIALSGLGGANLGPQVQRAVLHFSLLGLVQGSVDRLTIHGLDWPLKWTGTKVDPGLPFLQPTGSGTDMTLPPIQHIELHSSYLHLQYAGLSWPQPLSADLYLQGGQDGLRLALESSLLGMPLGLNGRADLQQGTFRVQGQLSDLGRQKPMATQTLVLKRLQFGLNAQIDRGLKFHKLDGELHLESLRLGRYLLSDLDLQLGQVGQALDLSCQLQEPRELQLELAGRQGPIQQLLLGSGPWQGEFSYQLQGRLPQAWLKALAKSAVIQSEGLPLASGGKLQVGLERGSGQWSWRTRLLAQKNQIGPVDLDWPGLGLSLEGLSSRAPLQAEFDEAGLRVGLGGGGFVGLEAARLTAGGKTYRLAELGFGTQSKDRVGYHLGPDGRQGLDLDLRLADSVQIKGPEFKASLGHGTLSGKLRQRQDRSWHGVLEAGLERAGLKADKQGLAVSPVWATIPVVFGDASHGLGRFEVGGVKAQGIDLPGPKGSLIVKDDKLELQGLWQVLPEIPLELDLALELGKGGLFGSGRVWSGWFSLPRPKELAQFSPWLQDANLEIAGRARLDLQAEIRGKQVRPTLHLEVKDGQLRAPDSGLLLQGLSAAAIFDQLNTLQTARQQGLEIGFSELAWRGLGLRGGSLALRLVGDRLLVDSGSCRLVPEGIIRLCQGRWDLKRGRGSARIYLQGIDALHLVQELTEDKLVGSGLFSGSFALGWDGRKVSIQGGHLYSLPGSGRLGIRDEVWLDKLLFYVRHGLQGQSYLFLLNERLELAFREFEYDFFSLRLLPKDKEVKARIELRGQGVRGDQPQQVGSLVFNVSGVQQALNQTLRWCREEEVQQTLERLLGPEP